MAAIGGKTVAGAADSVAADSVAADSGAVAEGSARVCVGQFAGAHGVRGLVRLRSFTQSPQDIVAYGPMSDLEGRRQFAVSLVGRGTRGFLLAQVAGVTDRDQAILLAGVRLYVARALLPPLEEEDVFYHADLVGCVAHRPDGAVLGVIRAVFEVGGGDVLEIAGPHAGDVLVPFTRQMVPHIDLAARRVTVDPPILVEAG